MPRPARTHRVHDRAADRPSDLDSEPAGDADLAEDAARGERARSHHPRRTQAERSASTINKLLEATAACLASQGYARTSTTEICRQAGVSRGAMLHHFPSKAVLVAAACQHVFETRAELFRQAMAQVPERDDRLDAAIDVLWQLFQDDTFAAWYELIVAGRTDPDLQPHVALVAGRLLETVRQTWAELFVLAPGTPPEVVEQANAAPLFMFAVLDGLAVERMTGTPGAEADAARVLALVKSVAEPLRSALSLRAPGSQPARP